MIAAKYKVKYNKKYNSRIFIVTMIAVSLGAVCLCSFIDDDLAKLKIKNAGPVSDADRELSMRVKSALIFHHNVSATRTKVSVRDGVVTLQGEADSQAQKELTEAYADDVKGVKDVDNFMTVKADSKKPKTIYNVIDDSSITSQIKTALLFHKSTSILRTEVKTKNGVVTLSGNVKNAAEKDLVAKLAGDTEGVKKVINDITFD